jgi:hypothetical protein
MTVVLLALGGFVAASGAFVVNHLGVLRGVVKKGGVNFCEYGHSIATEGYPQQRAMLIRTVGTAQDVVDSVPFGPCQVAMAVESRKSEGAFDIRTIKLQA